MEFGNPSSHTFGSSFMFLTTGYLLVKHYCTKMEIKQSLIGTLTVVNTIMVGIYAIGFSRVFKGVHTYNQVISGLVFGSILALMQCFVFYEPYFKFYVSIRTRSVKQLIFNQFTVTFSIMVLIGIYIHFDTQANFKVPQLWIDNIKKNCKVNHIDVDPETANFEKFYLGLSMIGVYIGVIIDQ
jgi:hypothetical protein